MPGWKWMLVPAFICLAVIGAYFGYRSLIDSKSSVAGQPTPQTALPLKLAVAEKQDQLDITWDRNAPAIAQAIQGVLTIVDGANKRDLTLSTTQLKNGRVRYRRLSGDVALRLEVFPEGQEGVSESIRIVLADPAPPAPGANPAEPVAAKSDVAKADAPKAEPPKVEPPKTPVAKTAVAAPAVPKPDTAKSSVAKSDVPKPDVAKPDSVKSAVPKSEVPKTDIAKAAAAPKKAPAAKTSSPKAQPERRVAAPPTPAAVTRSVEATPPPPAEQPQAPPPDIELQRPERRR